MNDKLLLEGHFSLQNDVYRTSIWAEESAVVWYVHGPGGAIFDHDSFLYPTPQAGVQGSTIEFGAIFDLAERRVKEKLGLLD
jgi:hypothetical protein